MIRDYLGNRPFEAHLLRDFLVSHHTGHRESPKEVLVSNVKIVNHRRDNDRFIATEDIGKKGFELTKLNLPQNKKLEQLLPVRR
jgi:hypothetical protein